MQSQNEAENSSMISLKTTDAGKAVDNLHSAERVLAGKTSTGPPVEQLLVQDNDPVLQTEVKHHEHGAEADSEPLLRNSAVSMNLEAMKEFVSDYKTNGSLELKGYDEILDFLVRGSNRYIKIFDPEANAQTPTLSYEEMARLTEVIRTAQLGFCEEWIPIYEAGLARPGPAREKLIALHYFGPALTHYQLISSIRSDLIEILGPDRYEAIQYNLDQSFKERFDLLAKDPKHAGWLTEIGEGAIFKNLIQ